MHRGALGLKKKKKENSIKKLSFSIWNLDLDHKTKYFKFFKKVFWPLYLKTKFFDWKTWFFHQAPRNHMFMKRALIQRSTGKTMCSTTVFIALTLQLVNSNMKATGNLCNNFISSVRDTRCGRGFRAFLNRPAGRA